MTNKNLENLYDLDLLVNKVRPHIQVKKGLLYKAIQIIVGEEESQTPEQTQKICDYFGIKPNTDSSEDIKDVLKIWSKLLDKSLKKGVNMDWLISKISELINQVSFLNIEWIIFVIACILVAVFFGKKYDLQAGKNQITATKINPARPAELCLVVPASIANAVKDSQLLSKDHLITLIDQASYFLCTDFNTADSIQEQLNMASDENIQPDSRREVYLRIHINKGGNMIDQKMPYYLKTNLPENVQGSVKKLVCLKNLSGLENFNHI